MPMPEPRQHPSGTRRRRPARLAVFVLVVCGALLTPAGDAPRAQSRPAFPAPAGFADADRLSKLRPAFAEIDRVFQAFAAGARVPGAAWGVIVDGRLVHSGAVGVRDAETKAPVDANTVFRIASMTKSFTALAILKLRDDGKLSLDDPAERYVPELKALTYRHHGLAAASPSATCCPTRPGSRKTTRGAISSWRPPRTQLTAMMRAGIPFSNAPGIAYEYSNSASPSSAGSSRRRSGRPYREYVAANDPEAARHDGDDARAGAVPRDRAGARAIAGRTSAGRRSRSCPTASFGAMGGMLTSVSDLARYVGAMLQAWPPRDGAEDGTGAPRLAARDAAAAAVLRRVGVARRLTGVLALNAGGYGYGLRITQTCAFRHIVAHSGGLPGFGSLMRWLPEYGVGLIAIGNLTYTGWGRPFATAFELLQKTGGLDPRLPQPSAALIAARDDVSRLVMSWDDALADRVAAMNLYRDRSKDRRRAAIDGAAREGRRLHHAAGRLRARGERAPRPVDHVVRARPPAGRDHAGANVTTTRPGVDGQAGRPSRPAANQRLRAVRRFNSQLRPNSQLPNGASWKLETGQPCAAWLPP